MSNEPQPIITTREEQNRKLAEWLGWVRHEKCPAGQTEGPCWIFHRGDHSEHIGRLPDFFTSEEANALLLEKMRPVSVILYSSFTQIRKPDIDGKLLYEPLCQDPDRKTAVCLAALALIQDPL